MHKPATLPLLISLIIGGQTFNLQAHPGNHEDSADPSIPGLRRIKADATTGSMVNMTTDGHYRYIEANGIPNHTTGNFPNSHNPNRMSPQHYNLRVPVQPQLSGKITPIMGMPFGIAINGVPFDPGTAELWNNDSRWHYEALTGPINLGVDSNLAHVQPSGAYHYHGLPVALAKDVPDQHSRLIGYAADGFPVYSQYAYSDQNNPKNSIRKLHSSYQLKQGKRATGEPNGSYDGSFEQDFVYMAGSGDLDECNGRFGKLPNYPNGSYAYFLTDAFPFIPRCLKGTPDDSFTRLKGPPPMQGGNNSPPMPPGRRPLPPIMGPPPTFLPPR